MHAYMHKGASCTATDIIKSEHNKFQLAHFPIPSLDGGDGRGSNSNGGAVDFQDTIQQRLRRTRRHSDVCWPIRNFTDSREVTARKYGGICMRITNSSTQILNTFIFNGAEGFFLTGHGLLLNIYSKPCFQVST